METNNTIKSKITRGDIFYYDFGNNSGSIQNGRRPVIIIQANELNENSPTVIVAALTTAVKKRYLPSHIYLGAEFGLQEPSMVLLEQLRTVNKSELLEYVGTVDDERMLKIVGNGIKKTFGLWFYHTYRTSDIRCLCSKCLSDYKNNRDYIVKRVDPFKRVKDKCDRCSNYGYDYFVVDKRQSHTQLHQSANRRYEVG